MILYIKQKVFSIGDAYNVYDEQQRLVYRAKGEVFALANKVHMYDSADREVMFIKQRLFKLLPAFEVYQGDRLFATVVREFTFFHKKIKVESDQGSFVIEGDIWSHNYTISCNENMLGTVQKEWISWGDVYALHISAEEYSQFFVALVLAIDCTLETENRRQRN